MDRTNHPGAQYLAELEMSAKMVKHWVGLYAREALAIVDYVAAEKARADAAEAVIEAGTVGVKPLEWVSEDNGDFIAQSVISWYHIGLPHRTWNLTTPQGAVSSFDTIEAAKAAAQADYEARILSVLTTSPKKG